MECNKYHTLLQLYYYYLKLQISIGSTQFIILNEILQALIASIFFISRWLFQYDDLVYYILNSNRVNGLWNN